MEIILSSATAMSIKATLPLSVRMIDSFAKGAEIHIRFQGEDFERSREWFKTKISGSTLDLKIKGKPGFCLASLHYLLTTELSDQSQSPLEFLTAKTKEMEAWNLRLPYRDLFQSPDEISLEITAPSHRIERTVMARDFESGAKCSIFIKGKPGFAQLAAQQMQLSAPALHRVLGRILSSEQESPPRSID